MASFELTKPGYFKRFVECDTTDDALWLARLVGSIEGVTIRRLSDYQSNWSAVHYKLPSDTARALFEIQLYYTAPVGSHSPGDLDGRVGDFNRDTGPGITLTWSNK